MNNSIKPNNIAKNSFILLLRMLVLMLINLYAVRVVTSKLGFEDYGLFSAVAGVVTTLSCLSSVFSVSTQRFYSFLDGRNEQMQKNWVFSISMNINIVTAILIIIIFETVVLWFLNTKMVIPDGREFATNCLFQCTLFVFLCSLIQIPFTAAIIANEDMGYYTIISAIECTLKLCVALLIGLSCIDKLVFYGIGLMCVALFICILYAFIGIRKYQECRYVKVKTFSEHRRLLSFSGWVMFGSLSNVGLVQGNMILLNIFFGPLANAAFGISQQIYNAFNTLTNSVVVAMRPSMNRLYAEGDKKTLLKMFYTSNKFLILATMLIAVPLFFEMEYVLGLWLNVADSRTVIFCRLTLIYFSIFVLNNPITILMQSAGKLKKYHLTVESVMLMCVPITLLMFVCDTQDYFVYYSMIGLALLAHCVRLYCLQCTYDQFSPYNYLRRIILPLLLIAVVTCIAELLVVTILPESIVRLLVSTLVSATILLTLMLLFGLNIQERQLIKQLVLSKFNKGTKR